MAPFNLSCRSSSAAGGGMKQTDRFSDEFDHQAIALIL
jgi:hypothetical protein